MPSPPSGLPPFRVALSVGGDVFLSLDERSDAGFPVALDDPVDPALESSKLEEEHLRPSVDGDVAEAGALFYLIIVQFYWCLSWPMLVIQSKCSPNCWYTMCPYFEFIV